MEGLAMIVEGEEYVVGEFHEANFKKTGDGWALGALHECVGPDPRYPSLPEALASREDGKEINIGPGWRLTSQYARQCV